MSVQSSKVMSAKVSASLQSGDSTSLLKIALFVGVAVLVVLLLIFLYKKFLAKKPHNEYFAASEEDEHALNSNPQQPIENDEEFILALKSEIERLK